MLASPVPIYLGCAGLIVGGLGLGAQYMLGGNSVSATNTASEQPLFARSVEEASFPTPSWQSQQGAGVAHYQPTVELLTTPARSTPSPAATAPQPQSPPAAARNVPSQSAEQPQQQEHAAPREVVRDLAEPQTRQSRRARNQRNWDDTRASEERTAPTEQLDPRTARAQDRQDRLRGQDRQRNVAQTETERRDGGPRRFDRRSRDRDDGEAIDTRSRSDRRLVERDDRPSRDGERRVVVREEIREPEPRIVRRPEPRDGGFSPFRLFGIFDR